MVLDDSSIFIERSIDSVQGGAPCSAPSWSSLIIFLFLRDVRSTLIICTSIPISVIGTFALLYFAGFTLNTMTFGGLALGVGMIVDASIVVLENTFRHMEHGQGPDAGGHRRQRGGLVGHPGLDPDAHRGVRAAAVPDGHLEHHVQAARGRRDVLARHVALRRRDARPGALLEAAAPAAAAPSSAAASSAGCSPGASASLEPDGRRLPRAAPQGARTTARRCSLAGRGALRRWPSSCMPLRRLRADAADRRGRGPVDVELPVGTRIERTEADDSPARADGPRAGARAATSSSATAAAAGSWAARATAGR